VHGRLADITELDAPVDARSGDKKRLGPQGNDHRLAGSDSDGKGGSLAIVRKEGGGVGAVSLPHCAWWQSSLSC
jgi:hypothetical protein